MNKRKHASRHARHVVAVLAPHFADLQQEATAMVVTAAMERHPAAPDPAWEVILDSGYTANWRLRPPSVANGAPARARTSAEVTAVPRSLPESGGRRADL